MKVKIFSNTDRVVVEREINDFIVSLPDTAKVEIQFSTSVFGANNYNVTFSAMLIINYVYSV